MMWISQSGTAWSSGRPAIRPISTSASRKVAEPPRSCRKKCRAGSIRCWVTSNGWLSAHGIGTTRRRSAGILRIRASVPVTRFSNVRSRWFSITAILSVCMWTDGVSM